jgi:hypothetical protein
VEDITNHMAAVGASLHQLKALATAYQEHHGSCQACGKTTLVCPGRCFDSVEAIGEPVLHCPEECLSMLDEDQAGGGMPGRQAAGLRQQLQPASWRARGTKRGQFGHSQDTDATYQIHISGVPHHLLILDTSLRADPGQGGRDHRYPATWRTDPLLPALIVAGHPRHP